MKNYFVFVNYYMSNNPSPIDCDSILVTRHKDCLSAWDSAAERFIKHMIEMGYDSFVISEFKDVK